MSKEELLGALEAKKLTKQKCKKIFWNNLYLALEYYSPYFYWDTLYPAVATTHSSMKDKQYNLWSDRQNRLVGCKDCIVYSGTPSL